jgi:hypothetical protein
MSNTVPDVIAGYFETDARRDSGGNVALFTGDAVLDGQTSLQMLQSQLDVMEAKLDEVTVRLEERGVRRLIDNGRLLEEQIGAPPRSELTIPDPDPPRRGTAS